MLQCREGDEVGVVPGRQFRRHDERRSRSCARWSHRPANPLVDSDAVVLERLAGGALLRSADSRLTGTPSTTRWTSTRPNSRCAAALPSAFVSEDDHRVLALISPRAAEWSCSNMLARSPRATQVSVREAGLLRELGRDEAVRAVETVGHDVLPAHCALFSRSRSFVTAMRVILISSGTIGSKLRAKANWTGHALGRSCLRGHDGAECPNVVVVQTSSRSARPPWPDPWAAF